MNGIRLPHHTSIICTLDHDWLPNRMKCHKSSPWINIASSDLRSAQRNFTLTADEGEDALLLSNHAHTSFCTMDLKHPSKYERWKGKIHFWVEGDWNLLLKKLLHLIHSSKPLGFICCIILYLQIGLQFLTIGLQFLTSSTTAFCNNQELSAENCLSSHSCHKDWLMLVLTLGRGNWVSSSQPQVPLGDIMQ